ncbi:MAG: hypothetical protein KDI63_13650 [Gammaproteobacteria bacterium]|nr:hypothetical protein [Gammaproteobacteria bacterium]
MKMRILTLAVIFGCYGVTSMVMAAETQKESMTSEQSMLDKDARMAKWKQDKDELEVALGVGKEKSYYRQTLEKMGYAITSVNSDESDYLEYEIIKGGDSYEVQIDFENGLANEVDVTTNIWRAEATEQALENKDYQYTYPTSVAEDFESVSDRIRSKVWADEKDAIEERLGIGHERGYYRSALEGMGYTVTSINDNSPDNLEFEVVKGDTSYEVEVDFDEKTKKSTAVDISMNIWESEATERAKGEE